MLKPTRDTALQRPDLGQVAYEVNTNAPTMGYIGSLVMPDFPVPVSSMEYPVVPKESLFDLLDVSRGPFGHYNRFEGEFESGFFKTDEKGIERKKDDRFLKLYGNLFAYESMLAQQAQEVILRAKEYRIRQKVFNTTQFPPVNAAVAWATVANATPKADIDAGKLVMRGRGILPNALILNYAAFQNLKDNAEIKTRIYQIFPEAAKTGAVEMTHLQTYFDIPKIFIAGAQYNSANRGQAAVLSDMWGDQYVMLARIADSGSDITEPCIGRTFRWNEGASDEIIVEDYRDETVRADIIRVRHDVDEAYLRSFDEDKNVKSDISAACGYLIDIKRQS